MVLKKIACAVGIIAYLWAAFDLARLTTVFFFRLGQFRFEYFLLTILFLPYVFLIARAWKGKLTDFGKWVGVAVFVGGIGLMMRGTTYFFTVYVVIQVLFLLFFALGCLMVVDARKDAKMFPEWGKYILVPSYILLFIFLLAALYLPGGLLPSLMQARAQTLAMIQSHTPAESRPIEHVSIEHLPVASVAAQPPGDAERDLNFRWILPPRYRFVGQIFYGGRAWVQEKMGGPWKLIDSDGNVIKRDFMADRVFHGMGGTRFRALERDSETGWNMFGELDRYSGEIISEPRPFRHTPFLQDGFISKVGGNGLRGFIDFQENWIIPPIFENVSFWSEDLIAVRKNGKWGYINRDGDVVIDFQFEDAYLFSNGLAAVSLNLPLYGLIDREGNWVAEPVYERFFFPFSSLIGTQKNGRIGFLDTEGNVAIDFKFAGTEIPEIGVSPAIEHWRGHRAVFFEERAIVPVSNTRNVIINESGYIIPTEQNPVSRFSGGFAVGFRDGRLYLLDRDGRAYSLPGDIQNTRDVWIEPLSNDGVFRVYLRAQSKYGFFRVGN